VQPVTVQELIDAGVHFGHQASRWNPKMKPFIYGRRHRIHIINLQATIRSLYQATHFLKAVAAQGGQVLFLGTKRQIRAVVEAESRRCGMPSVTERWIGGTLTNFNTVREQLGRLEQLEAMESDGTLERHKKKQQSMLRREMRKIQRNLEGVRELHGLPAAIVVVDPRREENCLREAQRMNVPVVCLLDTDCDPDLVDIPIPGNDDAMSSVQVILQRLSDAVIEGRANMDESALIAAQRSAQDDPRAREITGRRQQPGGPGGPRRRRGEQPAGGRLGRRATGRFADRAGGHADAVSIGGRREERADSAPAAAPEKAAPAPAPAPQQSAPAPSEGADAPQKPAGDGGSES
jgi:small subunit ribosomal protein S2